MAASKLKKKPSKKKNDSKENKEPSSDAESRVWWIYN